MNIKRKGKLIKKSENHYAPIKYGQSDLITLNCKLCGSLVENCGPKTKSVICSECTQKMVDPPRHLCVKKQGVVKPRGWKFMKIFVDSEKNVFYKGIEQPELKGTLDVTTKVPTPKKKKLTPREKEHILIEKNNLFAEITELKNKIVTGNLTTKYRKSAEKEISKREKKIKSLSKK